MLKFFKFSEYLKLDRIPLVALIVIEVCAIVFAVMLGFYINQWREHQNQQKVVIQAKHSLAAELNYNHARMVIMFQYYDEIMDAIQDTIDSNPDLNMDNTFGYELMGFRGAMPPMLRSSSYQMLLSSGILQHFDFETADQLALIYQVQSMVERLDDASIRSFADDNALTRLSNIRHKFGIYNELIPAVLGFYEYLGVEILGEYGFNYSIENEKLQEMITAQNVRGM